MTVTLVAVLCHIILNGNLPVCVEENVPTQFSTQAGKASDPIDMGFTWQVCQSNGQIIVADWASKHPVYRAWQVRGWKCVPGGYNSKHEA